MAVETVTVLFTDLVGSTALMSRLGEAAADELRREHFGLLRGAVAATGGREVKNTGDGLMVAFDGVGAALACSVAMQQAIAARPPGVEPLAIRVGVAVGEAEEEAGDWFGVPVVEAARLCALAGGGEILVTALVRLLARSRGGFQLESIGEVELKGLPEPVEALRVRWEPLAAEDAGGVPMSARVRLLAQGTFVGREPALERLRASAKAAGAGTRHAVLLAGEPGIGKTTLAAAFAVEAAGHGATVLYGRCDEEVTTPYQPWVEALGHLVGHLPSDLLAAHVVTCGPVLARIVGELRTRLPDAMVGNVGSTDADVERHLLFGAVVDLLGRAATDRLVVLLLDDLHWADPSTIQLLRHVLTADRPLPLLVIGTFRDSDVPDDHPLADALGWLHREHGVERLALGGLGDQELLALLEAFAGHELDATGLALRDALLDETDGNPFFVGELLRHLRETDALRQGPDGRWTASIGITDAGLPVSIREVIGRRVRWLGEDAHQLLTMAAVLGRDFDAGLLARVCEQDVEDVLDACDGAAAAAVLRATDRVDVYSFAHALIQRSLYGELSPSRRARAHRTVAEAIEAEAGARPERRAAELAHHWARAARPQDAAKAVRYATLAGDQALARLAPADALRWYREARALLDGDDADTADAVQPLIGIATSLQLLGDPGYHDAIIDAATVAARLGDGHLLARAVLVAQTVFHTRPGVVDLPLIDLIRRALALVGDDDSPVRARLLTLLAVQLLYDGTADAERLALAADAIGIARRLGDERTLAEVLVFCDEARSVPELALSRLADTEEACRIADRLGDLALRCAAHNAAACAGIESDRAAFDRHLAVLQQLVPDVVVPTVVSQTRTHELFVAMYDGDPDRIELAGTVTYQAGLDAGVPETAEAVLGGALLVSGWFRGAAAELAPFAEQAVRDNPGLPVFRAALGLLHAESGDRDAAAALLAEAAAGDFVVPRNTHWTMINVVWAQVAARVGDRAAAATLLPRLEPWVHLQAFARGSIGYFVAHVVGGLHRTLGDPDAAVTHLEHAVELATVARAHFFVADSQVALAAALADRGGDGDAVRARTLARTALADARRRGFGYVERDALEVLARLGATDAPRLPDE